MQNLAASVALLLVAGLVAESPALGNEAPPAAYPVNLPGLTPAPDNGIPRHVPDSDARFTLTQIRDLFFAPDWHPEDHPSMPEIVARGRKPDVRLSAHAIGPMDPAGRRTLKLPVFPPCTSRSRWRISKAAPERRRRPNGPRPS